MAAHNWIDLTHDVETGIETIRAHFEGHVYDPHWHDSYLIGITEQGIQQFNCRKTRCDSTPGQIMLLDPGEVHDGNAPEQAGFTYSMLYLEPQWMERELLSLFADSPVCGQPSFVTTLVNDSLLAQATINAFQVLRQSELRIVRQTVLDTLLRQLLSQIHWPVRLRHDPRQPAVAQRARDFLHANLHQDVGLDDVSHVCGIDRFRLTRAFKAAYGLAPHAYLIQLRLTRARQLLAKGQTPVQVACALGFADQSHLGRWFQRAYRLTPADYRKRCTNRPD